MFTARNHHKYRNTLLLGVAEDETAWFDKWMWGNSGGWLVCVNRDPRVGEVGESIFCVDRKSWELPRVCALRVVVPVPCDGGGLCPVGSGRGVGSRVRYGAVWRTADCGHPGSAGSGWCHGWYWRFRRDGRLGGLHAVASHPEGRCATGKLQRALFAVPDARRQADPLRRFPVHIGGKESIPPKWSDPTQKGPHNSVVIPEDGKTGLDFAIPKK